MYANGCGSVCIIHINGMYPENGAQIHPKYKCQLLEKVTFHLSLAYTAHIKVDKMKAN